MRVRRRLLAAAVVVVGAAGVASPSADAHAAAPVAAGADHACIVPGGQRPVVAWSRLRNPVLGVAVLCVGVASLLVRSRA